MFLSSFLTVVLSAAPAADDSIDLGRVRASHTRVRQGQTLSPADQDYYDRGKIEWERQHKRGNKPADDPTSEVERVRKGEEFEVSMKTCPLEYIETTSAAGVKVVAVLRKPPGPGPFPALINLHGGLKREDRQRLENLATMPTASRFLAAGYMIVVPTFRDREVDPQTRDALEDCLTMIDWVKHRSDVDPASVVVWGDSGGGSLALELAGEADLAAVAAQEPATILMIGIMTKENSNKGPLMKNPKKYWTPELQTFARDKFNKIHCPVFIAYGDNSQINHVNHEIVIPELKAAGKQLETKLYPGEHHGFSKISSAFFEDADRFFRKSLKTAPQSIVQD